MDELGSERRVVDRFSLPGEKMGSVAKNLSSSETSIF
jgi:hypothetical protein